MFTFNSNQSSESDDEESDSDDSILNSYNTINGFIIEPDDASNSDIEEHKQLHCICRTNDVERFMIMCDKCEEW